MMRAVVVEDEPLARDLLRSYVARHEDLELVGEADDGASGLRMVDELGPDLVLLDIHLPVIDGITLARQMKRAAAIVFITAYDRHAMTAFELGAFDYLLKPVTAERFALAMERVRDRRGVDERVEERLGGALASGYLQHFFVRHLGVVLAVHVPDIVRLEADDDYTALYVGGKRLMVHVPLREMAARLDPAVFVRVHRCDVVNLAHVRSGVVMERRMKLRMADGAEVSTSRAGAQALQGMRF